MDIIKAMASIQSDSKYSDKTNSLSIHFIPFYAGIFFSIIGPLSKKYKSIISSAIMSIGVVVLLIEYTVDTSWSVGIMLINFAGGFFDGITPSYCIL